MLYLVISISGVTFGIKVYDFKMIFGPWEVSLTRL